MTCTTLPPEKSAEDIPQKEASSEGSRMCSPTLPSEKTADFIPVEEPSNDRSEKRIAAIMTSLCLLVFVAAMDTLIITTANPAIIRHFNAASNYGWIGSAFVLAQAVAAPTWGKMSDIFGRKAMLLASNLMFMVGNLIAALSVNIGMLITARAIQGVGAGGIFTLVYICIADLFPLKVRGKYLAIVGVMWAVAAAAGPVLGGVFADLVTWRWCFWINLPIQGIATAAVVFFLNLNHSGASLRQAVQAVDWIGSLLISGGTVMLLLGLLYGGATAPWTSAEVICLIVFGVLTIIGFICWEHNFAKYPILPTALFLSIPRCMIMICVICQAIVQQTALFWLPTYFQEALGASPLLSGVWLLLLSCAWAVGIMMTGPSVAKLGTFVPQLILGSILTSLGVGLFILFQATEDWAKLAVFQIILGIGIGINFQNLVLALQAHTKAHDVSTGTATLVFLRVFSFSIAVVVGQAAFQSNQKNQLPALQSALGPDLARQVVAARAIAFTQLRDVLSPAQQMFLQREMADSFRVVWIVATAISGVALVAMWFIPNQKTDDHHQTRTGLEQERLNAQIRAAEKTRDRSKNAT